MLCFFCFFLKTVSVARGEYTNQGVHNSAAGSEGNPKLLKGGVVFEKKFRVVLPSGRWKFSEQK